MFEAPQGYLIEKLRPQDKEGIIDVALKMYTKGEPLGDLIGLSYDEFKEILEPLILDWLKYDFSVAAKCQKSKEIVGLLLAQPLIKGEELLIWGKIKTSSSKARFYTEVCAIVESAVDVFDHFGVDKVLDHAFLAVSEDHRQKGIGLAMAKAISKIGEEKDFKVFAVTASNKFTKFIYQKLGFSSIYKLDYNTLEFNGKKLDLSLSNGTEFAEVLGIIL